jgi:hypothetical protein
MVMNRSARSIAAKEIDFKITGILRTPRAQIRQINSNGAVQYKCHIICVSKTRLTLVFTICNFRGLDCGWSAAPTNAMRDVQKSISTMPLAPSSYQITLFSQRAKVQSPVLTHCVNTAKWVAVCDTVTLASTHGDASATIAHC